MHAGDVCDPVAEEAQRRVEKYEHGEVNRHEVWLAGKKGRIHSDIVATAGYGYTCDCQKLVDRHLRQRRGVRSLQAYRSGVRTTARIAAATAIQLPELAHPDPEWQHTQEANVSALHGNDGQSNCDAD